jgi:hypothetical protein
MEMKVTTVIRFKNGYINIAATVRRTAKRLGYDEVNAQDIAHELACQGLTIADSDNKIADYGKNTISVPQIRRALSNNFYHCGKGYYANSVERATEAWWNKYHKDGCTCRIIPISGAPDMIGGNDDCPVHGFGK